MTGVIFFMGILSVRSDNLRRYERFKPVIPVGTLSKVCIRYISLKPVLCPDPSLTAAQIPHKYQRAKRVTTHCDPTLTVAQIPHKCLRAKRATTHCDPTLTVTKIHRFSVCDSNSWRGVNPRVVVAPFARRRLWCICAAVSVGS